MYSSDSRITAGITSFQTSVVLTTYYHINTILFFTSQSLLFGLFTLLLIKRLIVSASNGSVCCNGTHEEEADLCCGAVRVEGGSVQGSYYWTCHTV